MSSLLYIILGGFLARADGWGTDNPRLKPLADFFNAFSCSALFALLCYFSAPLYPSIAAALAFLTWRLFGFRNGGMTETIIAHIPGGLGRAIRAMVVKEDGWQSYSNMFVRGAWTSLIGLSLVSLTTHGHPFYGLLFIPFAATYACIYTGGHTYLPQTIFGFDKHVWVENASGWLLYITLTAIWG